jgi:hypothetical protein
VGEQGAADLGVAGDVGDCISDGVHALSVLVRNFNGEFLFNGQHKLHARESENKNIEAPAINMSQARAHAQVAEQVQGWGGEGGAVLQRCRVNRGRGHW